MNLSILCQKISLQEEVKNKVLAFVDNFSFEEINKLQLGYYKYSKMIESLTKVKEIIGDDEDGIKVLSCMLIGALNTYKIYQEKQIPEEIFFDTMKCFTRFIDETYVMSSKYVFDRFWWTTRQVGCHLFRIGELEYEIRPLEDKIIIDLHIPSNCDLSPSKVNSSLLEASKFFNKYYPELINLEYHCHSWLLDEQLKTMLKETSNIISFQNRFEIYDIGEEGTDFLNWVFKTKEKDYTSLIENTSLQRNMKKHLLKGGIIRNSKGKLKI